MSFVDELTISCSAGNGGNGIVSWLKEKYRPMGGPAGGNGGDGGDLYFKASRDLNKLSDYSGNPKFDAQNGGHGGRKSKEGLNGEDLYVELPVGCIATNLATNDVYQLLEDGESICVLKGGHKGYGNESFKSSRNTTPYEQTDGSRGESADFYIELQLLVDVGMVGLPSAGKSSLVNTLTGSQMKVADYHFTTLEPGLGMFHSYVLADIPGLIKNAATGKGLGHKFLRHIKRTRAIAHLISFENLEEDIEMGMWNAYTTIRNELIEYSDTLGDKEELVVLSKTDLVDQETVDQQVALFTEKLSHSNITATSIINDNEMEQFETVFSNFLQSLDQKAFESDDAGEDS